MQYSNMRKVWKKIKSLVKLEVLNLSHSQHLIKTPDFFGLPSLKILLLEDCTRLFEIHQSIGFLDKLVFLNLGGCRNLRNLPSSIYNLKSLESLNLSGCSKLKEFPEHLWGCNKPLPIKSLFSFLWSWLPPRNNFDSITVYPGGLYSLTELDFSWNNFCSLPTSISHLSKLKTFRLNYCTNLQSLPQLPQSLQNLEADGCQSLERISNLSNLKDLSYLWLDKCTKLVEIQGLENLDSIEAIHIERCNNLVKTFKKSFFKRKLESGRGSTTIVLPASGISNWFSHQRTGSSISFDMPSHPERKLRGLTVWAVFGVKEEKGPYIGPLHAVISNKTKGVEQRYGSNFPIPKAREDHAWVSYKPQEDFEYPMEVGDQVEVSFKGWEQARVDLQVKKCGIQLEYETDEKENNQAMIQCASPSSYEYADAD